MTTPSGISAQDIVSYGEQFEGTPYVWGGNSLTSGVDCSGLVQQVFKNFGINLPRTTYDQIGVGTPVASDKLQVGDLVFFSASPGTDSPDHVAIYVGNGNILEAPKPGEAVRVTSMANDYYMSRFVGGRQIAGVNGSGSGVNFNYTGGAAVAPKLDPQELAAQYGWSYAFLNSNPDLKNVFSEAVAGTWSTAQFQAALQNTNWWKDNSDTAKQALVTQQTDPAQWNAQVLAMNVQITQMAKAMGAAIPASQMGNIVNTAIKANLDNGQLEEMLGSYVNFQNNGTLGGAAGAFQHTVQQYAYSQGVNLSDQAVKNQAQLIVKGLMTQDDAEAQIRQTAISTFPAYEEQINGGATMNDIAQPYIQTASQLLEQPDTSYSLNTPMIRQALNGTNAQGQPNGMTQSDFENMVRQSPQWQQTNNARDSLYTVAHQVLQDFGKAF
jgi:hypothetical protein